jgi:putative autoinducer-2 (AI-2) aldolase
MPCRKEHQADAPEAMMKTVHKVVHENLKPAEALEMYEILKNQDK